MDRLPDILKRSAARHKHLCPRQVLGARMGLFAGELLGIDLPRRDKRLLVISETDGCAVIGVGRRELHLAQHHRYVLIGNALARAEVHRARDGRLVGSDGQIASLAAVGRQHIERERAKTLGDLRNLVIRSPPGGDGSRASADYGKLGKLRCSIPELSTE